LLTRWGLPECICFAVEHHHQPPATGKPHSRLAAVVNFANCLAHQLVEGPAQALPAADASPAAMALVELTAADIPAVMQQINEDLLRVQGLLQIQP
jgi:HD-like signal output (HDOD) protein